MLEILQNFEQATTRFAPLVLIVTGLAAVAVGLFVWLRGLSLRRPLAGLLGGISGAICGFFLSYDPAQDGFGRNIVTTAIITGIAVLIAIIFQRLIITILLAALATIVCFTILIAPYMTASDETTNENQPVLSRVEGPAIAVQDSTMSIQESLQTVKAYAVNFIDKIKYACRQMPLYNWAIIAVSAVILIIPGLILWRLASSLFFSALGTILIFSGMILLLSYKGSAPISRIANRSSFYTTVFIVMIVFGTLEQLLLCRRAERKAGGKKQAADQHESEQTTRS
jgi:hypothetical protein